MSFFEEDNKELNNEEKLDYGYEDEEQTGEITKSSEDIARSDIEVDDTFENNNVESAEDEKKNKGSSSDSTANSDFFNS